MEKSDNYELVIKDVISHLFTLKATQRHKRYLHGGLDKPRDDNICDIIFRIDEIVEHLDKFPPFGNNQGLSDYKVLKIMEFLLP